MRIIEVGDRVVLVESGYLYDHGDEPRGVVIQDLGHGAFVIRKDDGSTFEASEESLGFDD